MELAARGQMSQIAVLFGPPYPLTGEAIAGAGGALSVDVAAAAAAAASAQAAADNAAAAAQAQGITVAAMATAGEQSSALQAAINAANATSKRRVLLPEGRFSVRDVSIPTGTQISGRGIDRTILQRAGSLATAILNFATGAGDILISDLTIDGLSAADARSLVNMGAHGSRIEFRRVKFVNGCGRWALRGDPTSQFRTLKIIDCEWENLPSGGLMILAGSMGARYSSGIEIIGNKMTQCGANLFSLRDYEVGVAAVNRGDFWYDVKFNFNRITDCLNTGADGPIPTEIWGPKNFQMIGNLVDTGTRGLGLGGGAEEGIIAHNIIRNQTIYAMEGGKSENIKIFSNIAINCQSFYKDTGAAGCLIENLHITDNIIIGTGLTSYSAGTPRDVIAIGNDLSTLCTGIIIKDNRIYDPEFVRNVIRLTPVSGSDILVKGNECYSRTFNSATNFIAGSGGMRSEGNKYVRTANLDSTHHNQAAGPIVYTYAGSTSSADAVFMTSDRDSAQMSGVISSGTLIALGKSEAATARYGCRISNFAIAGNWTSPFNLNDNSGSTVIEGVDIRQLSLSGSSIMNNVNASLMLGLASGEYLFKDSAYVNLGAAKAGGRRRLLHYEGSVGTRTIKIRHDKTTGEQTHAIFRVGFVCTQNNGAPQENIVTVSWGNVSAPTGSPSMRQDGGAPATLASGLNGSQMEATITLPTSNNDFMVKIEAEVSGRGTTRGFQDFSVRVG